MFEGFVIIEIIIVMVDIIIGGEIIVIREMIIMLVIINNNARDFFIFTVARVINERVIELVSNVVIMFIIISKVLEF